MSQTKSCQTCGGTGIAGYFEHVDPGTGEHLGNEPVECPTCVDEPEGVSTSLDRALEEIDAQIAEMPKAESAGRSHLARRRLSDWVAHQVAGSSETGGGSV